MTGKRTREELSDQEGGRLGADSAGGGGGGEVAGGEGRGRVTKGENEFMGDGLCATERRLLELRAQGVQEGVGTSSDQVRKGSARARWGYKGYSKLRTRTTPWTGPMLLGIDLP